MAWSFGDGFDLYAGVADCVNNYWDSSSVNPSSSQLVAGRFTNSRALNLSTPTVLIKTSGVNDAVHHFVCGFQCTLISGAALGNFFTLYDGATAQCSVVFRTDGAILLTSGIATGTILATYTGAFPTVNTWYAFEFEVVVNNTTGSFAVRKNGNTVNDFSATGLNTRNSANNYANQLRLGSSAATSMDVDDFFWRSDAASVAWMGDIRCYTRMPSSNAGTPQFSVSGTHTLSIGAGLAVGATANRVWYSPYTVTSDGTIGSATLILGPYTGNTKCALFNDSSGVPSTILATATNIITNPAILGSYTFTFSPAAAVTNGQHIWMGICQDTTNAGSILNDTGVVAGQTNTVAYASFPVANPTGLSTSNSLQSTVVVTPTSNYAYVNESQEDGLATYVYDNVAGHADFYGIAGIGVSPPTVFAVTTRGYMQKSDVGSRTASVQLRSGATTVATPTVVLTNSGFQWAWRTDLVDPNTSAAWTSSAVDAVNVGPLLVS